MNSTITEEMEKAITSKEKHLKEKICKTLFKTTDTNYHLHQQMTDASACVQVRVCKCVFVQVRACACVCVSICLRWVKQHHVKLTAM